MLKQSQVRTNRAAFYPAEPDDDVWCEERLDLEELVIVQDGTDDLLHVVGLVRRVGHQLVQLAVVVGDGQVNDVLVDGRVFEVVLGQVREQVADVLESVGLVSRQVVGVARLGVVGAASAEVLH